MYVETVPNRNSRPAVLLREGWREGERVRKRTLANLTDWPAEKVDSLRRVLKGQRLVSPEDAFTIERSLPHGHVDALLAMTRRLGLDRLIAPKPSPERDRVLAMVVQRLLHPASKLATPRRWHTTTLAQELDLGDADEDALYEAMDWLLARQERIERRLAQRHLHEGAPVFADVSGSYYEGRTCPLMRFGYNRDGKRAKPQVVYTVLSAPGGCPVAVQAYPGNTADPNTVADQVVKLREHFGLQRVVLVGDRGLLTQVQIDHLKRHPGLGWVSALRAVQVRSLVEAEALQLSLFDEQHLAEFVSPDYPGERLVACYNPLLAEDRARKRETLLTATEAGLERIAREAARRTRTPLDAAQLGHKVGRVIARHKMAKHFHWEVHDGRLVYERDHARIDAEARPVGNRHHVQVRALAEHRFELRAERRLQHLFVRLRHPAPIQRIEPLPLGIVERERPTPRLLVTRRPIRPLRVLHRDHHTIKRHRHRHRLLRHLAACAQRRLERLALPLPLPTQRLGQPVQRALRGRHLPQLPKHSLPLLRRHVRHHHTRLARRQRRPVTRDYPRTQLHRRHRALPATSVQRAMHSHHTRRTRVRRVAAQHPTVPTPLYLHERQVHIQTRQRLSHHFTFGFREQSTQRALHLFEVLTPHRARSQGVDLLGQSREGLGSSLAMAGTMGGCVKYWHWGSPPGRCFGFAPHIVPEDHCPVFPPRRARS